MAEPGERPNTAPADAESDASTDNPEAPQASGAGGASGGRAGPQESLGGALTGLMGVLLRRGRVGVERAAVQTRFRLDLRQLKRDRDVMYQKLGRELRALIEAGELHHAGLARGVERIAELDRKIAAVEGDLGVVGAPDDEPAEDPAEGA